MIIAIAVAIIFAVCIPLIVHYHIARNAALRHATGLVLLLAYVWLTYALFYPDIRDSLGWVERDAATHRRLGMIVASDLRQQGLHSVVSKPLIGNPGFRTYLGTIYYLTDDSLRVPVLIHMMLAFWGGATLASTLTRAVKDSLRFPTYLIMLVIFTPSAVYWPTADLKEALTYFGLVQILALIVRAPPRPNMVVVTAGVVLGGAMRPHMTLLWLCSLISAGIVSRRGPRAYAILALAAAPLFFVMLDRMTPFDATDLEEVYEERMKNYETISSEEGSQIGGPGHRPILFVSGFISLFFRPFPWNVHSATQAAASFETWLITIGIAYGWWSLGRTGRYALLREPPIIAAVCVCGLFCLMFTWMGNEGLLVRQKLQALPALMTLLVLSVTWKPHARQVPKRSWAPTC